MAKLCKECKHYSSGVVEPRCFAPGAASQDPVHGWEYCKRMRAYDLHCGNEGKWWEPKVTILGWLKSMFERLP